MLGVLQARMSSQRLPGKVLAPIEGVPMLLRQIDRIQRADRLGGLVVATSLDPSDDPIADVAERSGVPVARGPLDDVLGRFIVVIDEWMPESVVRLTADCPLMSAQVIDTVITEFEASDVDYCSNTLHPTFPDGTDVEVVRADALRWIHEHTGDRHEREHVTLGVYRRPERFRLLNVSRDVNLSHLRWTVDTEDDLAFAREIYRRLLPTNPHFELEDILELLRVEPGLSRTEADERRNSALDGLDTGAMRHER